MQTQRFALGDTIPIYRVSARRDTSLWPRELMASARATICSSSDAAREFTAMFISRAFRDLMLDQGHSDRENIMIAALDTSYRLNGVMLVAIGSERQVHSSLTAILRSAIQMDAAFLVLGHNHPHGGCRKRGRGMQYFGLDPSPEDLLLTEQLYAATSLVGIQLADHLILGGVDPDKWRSCEDQPYLSMWGKGYFRKHMFPRLASVTIGEFCTEVGAAARRCKKVPGRQHN